MGRKLMRVPLDFDWPMHKVWHGYQNPHYKKCPDCERGYTVDREWLESITHLLLMTGDPSREVHPWLRDVVLNPGNPPTKAMGELTGGLAGRPPSSPFGHDAIDRWNATKAITKAAGLDPETWGICPTCQGEALDPACKEAYEAWEEFEPPTGEGFQLWETTSEGSPTSPVFATLDALCEWAAPNASWFGDTKASAEDWRRALGGDGVSGLMLMQVGRPGATVDGLPIE